MWLRALSLLVTFVLGCESYSIAIIYPDRSSDYFLPYATEAVEAFETRNGGAVQVMVKKRHFNSYTLCGMLHGTVENLLEKSSSLHIFIIAPEIKEIDCYDQWRLFFSSRVLLVTPDQQSSEADKKVFWLMSGHRFRVSTWTEMADSIADIYAEKEQIVPWDDLPLEPLEDWLKSEFSTTRAARTPQSTTLSLREIQSKKFDDDLEERRQRRRVGMLLIGCGAVCTMALAFYIRNRLCKSEDKAEENDDKMEKAAITEADAKTAKNWTAKKKSDKK